jgi:hypothetical protein
MSTTPPPPGASPPPPGAPPPPPPGGAPVTSAGTALGPGQIVALVGAAVVALSTLLNWIDFEGNTGSAHNVPAAFLWNKDNVGDGGLGVGWLLILLMVVVVAGVFAAQVRWLAIFGGGLGALAVLLFLFQINSLLDEARDDFGVDVGFFDFATFWPLLALVASGAAAVGGIVAFSKR